MVIDTSEQYAWLHEGSQGYALSLDHGAAPFYGTSRNCTAAAAIDYLGAPPQSVNDVWLNIRTFPIRVGHITDDSGNVVGHSGPFYADQEELTWDDVARISGMPADEAALLRERERTTVTKRVRRVATFSWIGLRDAARTNGATKLSVNFVQYLNWSDFQKRGVGEDAYNSLSAETRAFIKKVEETANAKVHLIGTGPLNEDLIVR
jgi:adenylosuccinate synthase